MKKVQISSQIAFVGETAELCALLADELEALIRERAQAGKKAVLGLATGSTPIPLYEELIRRHRDEGLSFANVVSFNLDEYEGLGRDHERSYWATMQRNIFDHVDIEAANVFVPPSIYEDAEAVSEEYEEQIREAGGIDWQLLGIGGEGHIGFNEKGSSLDSRTRRVELARKTIEDAAKKFGDEEKVPRHAISMGVGTILEAKRVVLLAWGESKREIVHRAMTEKPSAEVPASFLQFHGNADWFLDHDASTYSPDV